MDIFTTDRYTPWVIQVHAIIDSLTHHQAFDPRGGGGHYANMPVGVCPGTSYERGIRNAHNTKRGS